MSPDELARVVEQFNERHNTDVSSAMHQQEVCQRLQEIQDVYRNAGDELDQTVIDLSNKLVRYLNTRTTKKRSDGFIESLRDLGATEEKAVVRLLQRPDLEKTTPLAKQKRKPHSPKSRTTQANRKAKMMAGKILSLHRQGSVKRDGTPLWASYVPSLTKLAEDNPDILQMASVQNALGLADD